MPPNKFAWEAPEQLTIEEPDDTGQIEVLENALAAVENQLRAAGVTDEEEAQLIAQPLDDNEQ